MSLPNYPPDKMKMIRDKNAIFNIISKDTDDVRLEDISCKVTALMEDMKEILSQDNTGPEDANKERWLATINRLVSGTDESNVMIGVVGNTGAGKSSVINAVVGEDILPTGCVGACTAVCTEIAFNCDHRPEQAYRAEITFISREEWMKELSVLKRDFVPEKERKEHISEANAISDVAFDKAKAIYPHLTKEELSKASLDTLIADPQVSEVLGTTKTFANSSSTGLNSVLQIYAGSQSHGSKIAYWPLVSVIRVFIKSKALETGARLVDLPGLLDSNTARAAVTTRYLQKCTGLWVVTPISRAADDKTGQSFLEESFGQKLKYDGIYSRISVICSRTDEISPKEVIQCFGLQAKAARYDHESRLAQKKYADISQEITRIEKSFNDLNQAIESQEEEEKVWSELKERAVAGEAVSQPTISYKRSLSPGFMRGDEVKKPRLTGHFEASPDEKLETASGQDTEMSQDYIEERLDSIANTKARLEGEIMQKSRVLPKHRREQHLLKSRMNSLDGEKRWMCIETRNEWVTRQIRHGFASKLRDADGVSGFESDSQKDYEELAKDLHVFCVSSKAYNELRVENENEQVLGFEKIDQSGIPELQTHSTSLTKHSRAAMCRNFLNEVGELLVRLEVWSSKGNSQYANVSQFQLDEDLGYLNDMISELSENLEIAITEMQLGIETACREHIAPHYKKSKKSAMDNIPNVIQKFGLAAASTCKAICRRDGIYHNKIGSYNINSELLAPLEQTLVVPWGAAFKAISIVLEKSPNKIDNFLRDFHTAMEKRVKSEEDPRYGDIRRLSSKVDFDIRRLQSHWTEASVFVKSRGIIMLEELPSTIQKLMKKGYEDTLGINGDGASIRMKQTLENHIQKSKNMFQKTTKWINVSFKGLGREVADQLRRQKAEFFQNLESDYRMALEGGLPTKRELTEAEKQQRQQTAVIIKKIHFNCEAPYQNTFDEEDSLFVGENDLANLHTQPSAGSFLESQTTDEPDAQLEIKYETQSD